jgi:hypothetical protein
LALEALHRVLSLNRAELTDVERTVLGARFALPGHDHAHMLKEVSGLIRLSNERARQMQNVALTKVRLVMEATFYAATTSSVQIDGSLEDLATKTPGPLGLEVLAAAGCGT